MRFDDKTILAFDTSGPHLSAALYMDGIQANAQIEMKKGQAEHLVPFIEARLTEETISFKDLDVIAVGVGPGNFTGIRISVSLARGLAMSLGIPAIAVSTFEAIVDPQAAAQIVSVAAPRDQAFVQHFQFGRPQSSPILIDPLNPPSDLALPNGMSVRGFMSAEIAKPFAASVEDADLTDIASKIAKFAKLKLVRNWDLGEAPTPLYVRPPDAAPPRDSAPLILET